MKKLNNAQIERLCNIVYLDVMVSDINKNNLDYIMRYMLDEGFEKEKELPCKMKRSEWENVVVDIIADSELGELTIFRFIDDIKTGNRAFCFMDSENNAYVVFRGTGSDYEWFDNALGMIETETSAQKSALKFVQEIRNNKAVKINYLCAAGHSKGGNKAQYCTVVGGDSVDCCVSVDGQGFSDLFFQKYGDIIEKAKQKISAMAERRDFVNCLGFYLAKPVFHTGRRGNKTEDFPYGEPLPFFHCPDALRTQKSVLGEEAANAYISKTINDFVTYYLTDKKYAAKREKTLLEIVSLMTAEKDIKKAAEGISEATLAFIELTAKSESFREDLRNLFEYENDVLKATAEFFKENEDDMINAAIKRFAEKLLLKPLYFHYFIGVSEKFMVYSKKIENATEKFEDLIKYIKTVFGYTEKLK